MHILHKHGNEIGSHLSNKARRAHSHPLGQNLKTPLLTIRWQTKKASSKKKLNMTHTQARKHALNFNLSGLRRGQTYAHHAAMWTGLSQDLTC